MDTGNLTVKEIASRVGITEKQAYNYMDKLGVEGKRMSKLNGQPKIFTETQFDEIKLGLKLKECEKLPYNTIRQVLKIFKQNGLKETVFIVTMEDDDVRTNKVFTVKELDKVLEVLAEKPLNVKIEPLSLEKYVKSIENI